MFRSTHGHAIAEENQAQQMSRSVVQICTAPDATSIGDTAITKEYRAKSAVLKVSRCDTL